MPKLHIPQSYIDDKLIRARRHPSLPLTIYTYTPLCQFSQAWNDITLKARGLILNTNDEIIVNPPQKFFNLGEPQAAQIDLSKALLLDKVDGYMIIVKNDPRYGLIVSSRGSFTTKYAKAAQKFITPEIQDHLNPNYSYFCELCQDFPGDENIILTKHPKPTLICWAIRDTDGNEYSLSLSPFPTVKTITDLDKHLAQPIEGVVAYDPQTHERAKIKTEYYLELHKAISNLTKKTVWTWLYNGQDVQNYLAQIPDEIYPQIRVWEEELTTAYNDFYDKIQTAVGKLSSLTNKELGQSQHPLKEYVFAYRKGNFPKIRESIFKEICPKYNESSIIDP